MVTYESKVKLGWHGWATGGKSKSYLSFRVMVSLASVRIFAKTKSSPPDLLTTPTYVLARPSYVSWLEVTEPSATNLACMCKINLWGVVWRGGLLDLASESHRAIRVGT